MPRESVLLLKWFSLEQKADKQLEPRRLEGFSSMMAAEKETSWCDESKKSKSKTLLLSSFGARIWANLKQRKQEASGHRMTTGSCFRSSPDWQG